MLSSASFAVIRLLPILELQRHRVIQKAALARDARKGKSSHFTILQLNALLKQDSNRRNMLTHTKLNTIQVPFTLISIVAIRSNEDFIALNGLKDCIVMYLNDNGQTKQEYLLQQQQQQSQQTGDQATATASTNAQPSIDSSNPGVIMLHPSLEGSNYIIKSVWLPDSQTELALVTCDFIKIYDLSVNKQNPTYHFLLPIGKIRDVTFVYDKTVLKSSRASRNEEATGSEEGAGDTAVVYAQKRSIVIMSSCGYLYYEEMNEQTSARNGVYYLTNTIEFNAATAAAVSTCSSSSANASKNSNTDTTASSTAEQRRLLKAPRRRRAPLVTASPSTTHSNCSCSSGATSQAKRSSARSNRTRSCSTTSTH